MPLNHVAFKILKSTAIEAKPFIESFYVTAKLYYSNQKQAYGIVNLVMRAMKEFTLSLYLIEY